MFHSTVQELAPPSPAGIRAQKCSFDEDCSVPPLDEVTVGSTTLLEDDDSSSVSSISSSGDLETRPRSIFKAYWDHTGYQNRCSTPLSEVKFSPQPSNIGRQQDDSSNDESSTNTYERFLKHNETPVDESKASPNSRRSIFGQACFSMSYPSLQCAGLIGYDQHPIRKTNSDSYLSTKKPLNSCLRSSRYGGAKQRKSSDQSVVSFHQKVDVVVFERPIETFAQAGWSDWFA